MQPVEIIKSFVTYADYDPERHKFVFGSNIYKLHTICQNVQNFLEFDPTGTTAVVYIKKAYKEFLSTLTINAISLFENPDIMAQEKAIWDMLNSPDVTQIERNMVEVINKAVEKINAGHLLGTRDINKEIEALEEALSSVVTSIQKCNRELYIADDTIKSITNFGNRIYVFQNLTDCILSLEANAKDGIYLCYIDYNHSADGYFGYFVKSNGNIFSLNDKVIENFPGQHEVSRNASWTDRKNTNLFPYDAVFDYSNYDYKGYATRFDIQDDKLNFMNLGPDVYMNIVAAMTLIANRYENTSVSDMKQVYCNTLLENNIQSYISDGNLPAVIANSAIATINRQAKITLTTEDIVSAKCVEEFNNADAYYERGQFPEENSMFVEMYGDGFEFDKPSATSLSTQITLYSNDTNSREEFTSTKGHMRVIAYKQGRQQLAEYIRDKMNEELRNFGGVDGVWNWFDEAVHKNQDKIQELFLKIWANAELTEEESALKECIGIGETDDNYSGYLPFNEPISIPGRLGKRTVCPFTQKTPSVRIWFSPKDWTDIERLLGPVPKIVKGWHYDNYSRGYGNPILSATDAVSFIGTPFERKECRLNKRLWDDNDWDSTWFRSSEEREKLKQERLLYAHYEPSKPMSFTIAMKFSKSGLRKKSKQYK